MKYDIVPWEWLRSMVLPGRMSINRWTDLWYWQTSSCELIFWHPWTNFTDHSISPQFLNKKNWVCIQFSVTTQFCQFKAIIHLQFNSANFHMIKTGYASNSQSPPSLKSKLYHPPPVEFCCNFWMIKTGYASNSHHSIKIFLLVNAMVLADRFLHISSTYTCLLTGSLLIK
jgi:hypothetical protein